MSRTDALRKERSEKLIQYLKENPLATDKMLSEKFNVSINTIRLDRARLGIKEFKERLKDKANNASAEVTTLNESEIVGDIIHFEPGVKAKSVLQTKGYMGFKNSSVIKGQYIYSLAETLAISLIPMKMALVGVANIKYFSKIIVGDVIYAEAEVKRKIDTGYIVWVRILDEKENIKFKGKFILKGIN
ncbi:MAG: transcription factor FapR [Clostridia bacterium]|nr:transcription factor FapR [Clostridia bacterium]